MYLFRRRGPLWLTDFTAKFSGPATYLYYIGYTEYILLLFKLAVAVAVACASENVIMKKYIIPAAIVINIACLLIALAVATREVFFKPNTRN